jgi:hypothetical protein
MLLVFASIIESHHPFGIVYLICAFLLNFLGAASIRLLSWFISTLVLGEYFLILLNYSNELIFPTLILDFTKFQK